MASVEALVIGTIRSTKSCNRSALHLPSKIPVSTQVSFRILLIHRQGNLLLPSPSVSTLTISSTFLKILPSKLCSAVCWLNNAKSISWVLLSGSLEFISHGESRLPLLQSISINRVLLPILLKASFKTPAMRPLLPRLTVPVCPLTPSLPRRTTTILLHNFGGQPPTKVLSEVLAGSHALYVLIFPPFTPFWPHIATNLLLAT